MAYTPFFMFAFITQTNPSDYTSVNYILVDPSCSGSGIVGRVNFDSEVSKHQLLQFERFWDFVWIVSNTLLLFGQINGLHEASKIIVTENNWDKREQAPT